MLRIVCVSLLIAALGSASACSRSVAPRPPLSSANADQDAAATARSDPRLFYPLDLGNRWRYHKVFTVGPADDAPFTPIVRRSSVEHEHVCVDPIAGREYVVDRITQVDSLASGPLTYTQWVRARQDPTGLFEADRDLGTPPACAGGAATAAPSMAEAERTLLDAWRSSPALADEGALDRVALQVAGRLRTIREALTAARGSTVADGELTRLRYPMTVGGSWTVRADPPFSATVEALDLLDLPIGNVPAYRVRMNPPGLGPRDRVLFWYGRSGLLGMDVHIEIPTDLGLLIAEDVIELEALSIGRGRF